MLKLQQKETQLDFGDLTVARRKVTGSGITN